MTSLRLLPPPAPRAGGPSSAPVAPLGATGPLRGPAGWLALLLGLLLASVAGAQDSPPEPSMPERLNPFWSQYWPAKMADDEEKMDRASRLNSDLAEAALDILIDDYSAKPADWLPGELRTLAWSLDRATRGTRYIERVRFVLGLERRDLTARHAAMVQLGDSWAAFNEGVEKKDKELVAEAAAGFSKAAVPFEAIGDAEFASKCWLNAADAQHKLGDEWERAVALQKALAQLAKLPFSDPNADGAKSALDDLVGRGYDPDQPKPEGLPGGGGDMGEGDGSGGAAPTGGAPGRTLDSLAPGSKPVTAALEQDVPRKGLAAISFPNTPPLDNFLLWPYSYVKGNGPTPFDRQRSVFFEPWGRAWDMSRDGAEFSIDTDGDGKPEVSFTPNTSPIRIDVPAPDGGILPLMVCIPGERESMFSMDLNNSPQPGGARLRFHLASSMDGQVLGEDWKLFDSNLTGRFGDIAEHWGDGITRSDAELLPTKWYEPDAVLVGKAKTTIPFSPVMPLGDGFARVSCTPDGKAVTVQPLALETGFVKLDAATKVPPAHVLIREADGKLGNAILDVVPSRKGGTVAVPAGNWRFCFAHIESGAKTSMKNTRAYEGRSKPFAVEPGKTVTLSLGGPYELEVLPPKVNPPKEEGAEPSTVIDFETLRIFGRGGEEWALLFDDPLQPDVELLTADGKKVGKPHKTRRAELEDWQERGETVLWFASPFEIVGEKNAASLVPKLSQKSHVLLGGPFATPGGK